MLLRTAAVKLIHIIFTEIIHLFFTHIINCGYDFVVINISQDHASILTGTLVLMQLDLDLDLISLQSQ